jgi:hypothetical protein
MNIIKHFTAAEFRKMICSLLFIDESQLDRIEIGKILFVSLMSGNSEFIL